MEPIFEQTEVVYKRNKITQLLIVILLLVVLTGVIIGYIYLGMNQAKNLGNALEPTPEEPSQANVDKEAIMAALAASTTSTMSAEEKEAVMAALAEDNSKTETSLSAEEKLEIMQALGQESPVESPETDLTPTS